MKKKIPNIIHYCWFGGNPLPKSAVKCIDSWKKFFPDYEIKEWNESNFDVNIIPYTAAAYKDRKYAFVSDYARFWILYNYGGVYFDTDVEVVRPLDDILAKGSYMGIEKSLGPIGREYGVNPGLGFAAYPHNDIIGEMVEKYSGLKYGETINGRIQNIVDYTTAKMKEYGWVDKNTMQICGDITIYPSEFFCPLALKEEGPELEMTENTHTIHKNAGTWLPKSVHIKNKIGDLIGRRAMGWLVKLKHIIKK